MPYPSLKVTGLFILVLVASAETLMLGAVILFRMQIFADSRGHSSARV